MPYIPGCNARYAAKYLPANDLTLFHTVGVNTFKPRLPLLLSVVLNEDSVFCGVTLVLDLFLTFRSFL